MPMLMYPVVLEVSILLCACIYIHTLLMHSAKASKHIKASLSVSSRDGYRQKNRIAIYHDTGPAYRDTYHDTYHKI